MNEPTTEAGRALWACWATEAMEAARWRFYLDGILAIEAESAARAAGIDADRMAEALLRVGDAMQLCATFEAMADFLIAEYVRLVAEKERP